MSDMVAVYTDEGRPVGQTFPRRARQLVAKQRAAWADEAQSAIRLSTSAEADWDDDKREAREPARPGADDGLLYELAKRRVREKRNLIWHTLALIPGFICLLAVTGAFAWDSERLFFSGWLWGAWIWAYLTRLYRYARPRIKGFRPANEEEKIARELARLRRES